jgi:hypothetical protein
MERSSLVAIVSATLVSLLLHGAGAAATAPATTPEAAVAQLVQETGATYAGDCATTQSPADVGKVCSRFIAVQGSLRAYWLGRTFSEFQTWAFVEQDASGWEPVGTVPLDPQATGDDVPWPAG